MKQIDLGPDEYRDVEAGIRERVDAIKAAEPNYPTPPPKPVLPDIKWVKPRIIDGQAVYRPSRKRK